MAIDSAVEPFYQRTVLPNGLRILTSSMPATHSISVSLYVGAGSRYERESEAGVSHFVEHLLFKGTEKYPSAKEVAEAIDGVGGVLNGGTDREMVMACLARQYVPDNSLMSVAGNIVPEEVVAVIDAALGGLPSGKPAAWIPAVSSNGVRCSVKYKSTEQAHLSIAVPAIPL